MDTRPPDQDITPTKTPEGTYVYQDKEFRLRPIATPTGFKHTIEVRLLKGNPPHYKTSWHKVAGPFPKNEALIYLSTLSQHYNKTGLLPDEAEHPLP